MIDGRQIDLITNYVRAYQVLTGPQWSRAAAARPELGPASAMSVTETDPPRHTRIRGLIGRAFAPRAVEKLSQRIQRRAADLLAKLRVAGPPADLVSQFCMPLAFGVHCDLLGIPENNRLALRQWSLVRSARPDATAAQVHAAETGLHDTVVAVLAEQRQQ
ncbi:MAG: cytochrome P450, partial [Pseudonocardiaceae bacterium]